MRVGIRDERGQSTAEWGLLALLIGIVAIVLLSVIGVDVLELFDAVENQTGSFENGSEPVPPIGEDDASEATARG